MSSETRNDANKFVATLVDGRVRLDCHFRFAELAKLVRGWEWDYVNRCWWLPLSRETLEMLRGVRQAQIDDAIARALGSDVDGTPDPIPDDVEGIIRQMPIKIRPYDHQVAAFKRCMDLFGGV